MLNLTLTVEELVNIIKNNKGDVREVLSLLNTAEYKIDNQYDSITEILEEIGIEARICGICGKVMIEGYCIEEGMNYACSNDCLNQIMTNEEFEQLYADGEGQTYYTDWTELNEDGTVIGGINYEL